VRALPLDLLRSGRARRWGRCHAVPGNAQCLGPHRTRRDTPWPGTPLDGRSKTRATATDLASPQRGTTRPGPIVARPGPSAPGSSATGERGRDRPLNRVALDQTRVRCGPRHHVRPVGRAVRSGRVVAHLCSPATLEENTVSDGTRKKSLLKRRTILKGSLG